MGNAIAFSFLSRSPLVTHDRRKAAYDEYTLFVLRSIKQMVELAEEGSRVVRRGQSCLKLDVPNYSVVKRANYYIHAFVHRRNIHYRNLCNNMSSLEDESWSVG